MCRPLDFLIKDYMTLQKASGPCFLEGVSQQMVYGANLISASFGPQEQKAALMYAPARSLV